MRSTSIKHWGILFCVLALAACGGGGSPEGSQSPADRLTGGGSSTDGGDSTGGGSADNVVKIGSGTGDSFAQGALAASETNLQAGDSATVTVNLVNGSNAAISEEVDITFSSDCFANGLASFNQTTVPTVAGRASAIYTAEGCSGTDVITASADVDDATLRAIVELSIETDEVLSVQYAGAVSSQLALAGMGGNETTRVSFKLVGAQGAPIRNESVTFGLNTTVGGVGFAAGKETAVSDNAGMVTTVLQSGTVSTTVRVTATHTSTGKVGVSEDITISTGVPVASHFSLSVSEANPAHASGTDGVAVTVQIIASDQYGNDALDGSQISFWSPESGNIESACTLESGRCAVEWISSAPRPADRRLTFIAYTSGAEDFLDTNGNNVYDSDDNGWLDISEPCLDEDEDGSCEPGVGERFVDTNENGALDAADGIWNGPCLNAVNQSALCPGADSTMIYSTGVIVMPTHVARIRDFGDFPLPRGTIDISGAGVPKYVGGLIIGDSNENADHVSSGIPGWPGGNPMPAGTTITFTTDNGEISGNASWTVPSDVTAPTGFYGINLKPDDEPDSGILTLTIDIDGDITEYWWVVTD